MFGFAFDPQSGCWRAVPTPLPSGCTPEGFTVATFNVLTDTFDGRPDSCFPDLLRHSARRSAAFKALEATSADLLGLNEVTPTFLEALLSQPWVRERYVSSKALPLSPGDLHPFGNVMLCSKEVGGFATVHSGAALSKLWRRVEVATVRVGPGIKGAFCAAHLTALHGNAAKREQELQAAAKRMPDDADFCVIFGDLNFHSESEEASIPSGYADIPYDGFSFDALRNPMIGEKLPHFDFLHPVRMKLDRILLRDPSGIFNPSKARLFADSSAAVPPPAHVSLALKPFAFTRRLLSLASEALLGKGLLRGDVKTYLFPSDHFGLVVTLSPHL